jgi:hypothetical protein
MTTEHEAFYLPEGPDRFRTTAATASPWDESMQHGGPPAALLSRAVEQLRPDPSMPIARITVDMLGAIPQGLIRTEARVVRPGRRIELVEASLWANDQLAVTATAWRIRATPGTTAGLWHPAEQPPVPETPTPTFFPGISPDWGYGNAVDWRFVKSGFADLGPALVWTRPKIPLVAGEDLTPVQRLLIVADSVNGISVELPMAEWFSIPPTMTATLQRPPQGEWILLDAESTIGPDGTGLALGTAHDHLGVVASIAQPLMVARRPTG